MLCMNLVASRGLRQCIVECYLVLCIPMGGTARVMTQTEFGIQKLEVARTKFRNSDDWKGGYYSVLANFEC